MYTIARCDKCGKYGILETRNLPKEEIDKLLEEIEFSECKFGGYHVELGKMADYVSVDYSRRFDDKEKAKEEVEKLNQEAEHLVK